MKGCTERCKARRKLIVGSNASSNNNTVKKIKLTLLQKKCMYSLPSINLKIDSGVTHHFQNNCSMNLTQQPTFNYNTEALVIFHNRASMVSSTTTNIPINSLPPSDTKYHGFNHI